MRGKTNAGTAPQEQDRAAVYVGKSGIHGKGLFAARAIPADALIMTVATRRTTKNGLHVIWVYSDDGVEGFEILNEARYVNHAAKPNAIFYADELYALRRIRKGEEITHHYGDDWDDL